MKSTKLLNITLTAVLCAGALYVGLRWLLPWLLPFLIAWGAAAVLEPLVGRLCRRGIPRSVAAGACMILALALIGGLLWLLLRRLGTEAAELAERLPEILENVSGMVSRWEKRLAGYMDQAPEVLREWIDRAAAGVEGSLAALPGKLSGRLLGLLPAIAASAPEALLFTITAVIGAFFISASYPELLHGAARLLPEQFLCRARLMRRDLRRTLGRWLKAQLIMLTITFAALAAAFLLLRIDYALLLALATAIIDALPVLGTGTVLLPWAAWAFLTGKTPLGIGLAVTYGAVTVLHESIQAKLLGDQLGLHPLATLLSIYVGFQVWGVAGMIVFPILAISLKQVLDSGVIPGKRPYAEYEGGKNQ